MRCTITTCGSMSCTPGEHSRAPKWSGNPGPHAERINADVVHHVQVMFRHTRGPIESHLPHGKQPEGRRRAACQ